MSDDVVLTTVHDRVGVITLNRPEKRNALNRAVQKALPEAIRTFDADDAVDVMVLTGADPAFSAGVDLKDIAAGGSDLVSPHVTQRGPFPPHAKPLIGAINGVAVTGGLELALNCDFLVASELARFADTHARVGILPGWGLTVLLPQAVGIRRARQMSATGNYVDASTALQWGLVNEVVPHGDLLPRALQLGADIASNDQGAVRRLFGVYAEVTDGLPADGWAVEARSAHDWLKEQHDPAEVERRRAGIMARGRAQQQG